MVKEAKDISEFHNEIVDLSNKMTVPDIAKKLQLAYHNVKRYMIRNNINRLITKGVVNESRFKTLEDEAAAYFYGFLVTDGYLDKKRNHVCLSLSHEDLHILETFKEWMESTNSIGTEVINRDSGYITTMRKFTFANKNVRNNLESYGLTPNKSKIATVPNNYKHENVWSRHFWRGVIDGDGSLFTNSRGARVITLVGSYDLCKNFIEFGNSVVGIEFTPKITQSGNIFMSSFSGRYAIEFTRYIYSGADPKYMLIRKYNEYLKFEDSEATKNKTRQGLGLNIKNVEVHIKKDGTYSYRPYVTTIKKRVHLGSFNSLEEALEHQKDFKDLYLELLNQ